RNKNRFIMDDEEEQQEGPANIVEIKAVVDSSDAAMDMRIGKAMAKELDRAVPVILGKLPDKSSRLNEDLRNQLSKNSSRRSRKSWRTFGETPEVTEEEISDLIEEGVKVGHGTTAPPAVQTTHPSSPAHTSRQPAPPSTQTAAAPAPATRPTQPTQPTHSTQHPTQPTQTTQEIRPAQSNEPSFHQQTRPSSRAADS
ncbi:hypothetical protein PFISCL1PPCAC_28661, partial [Pristionchus fissidentatus]